jgi:alginate O-acetyltransferase complex protein AlgI
MLFNSIPFLYLFLPITYVVFWQLRNKNQRYLWLTASGYVFYGCWNYKFCALMAFSTLVSYLAGRGLLAWTDLRRRRLCLVIPITIDLLLLGAFKYTNFLFESANGLARMFGLSADLPLLSIVLPVGISFYTFHTISYIIDSYRGVVRPTRNLLEFACYVSFFAQLVAGPIVRFRQVEADLENLDRAERTARLNLGWSFFTIGLVKKVLLADTLAAQVNPLWSEWESLGSAGAWLAALGYTYQLYFDFSGYSDMAVGLGHLFGIRLPQNFNSPYKATDIADFWRRWHISLSLCLRDYLYIPLGGSRGPQWQVYRNVLLTMLLAGLWHGANWTYVVWGLYQGLLLSAYRLAGDSWDRLPAWLRRCGTFLIFVTGCVIVRADNLPMAAGMLQTMFSFTVGALVPWTPGLMAVLLIAAFVSHFLPNSFELRHEWRPLPVTGLASMFVCCLAVIYGNQASPFLYFQF